MKRSFVLSLGLIAGTLMLTGRSTLWANEPAAPNRAGGPSGMSRNPWNLESMQQELGLSADQVAKIKSLRENQMTTMKPFMDKNRDLMKKLEDQVKNKASDNDLLATLSDIETNRKSMMEQGEKNRTSTDALLTPMQRAKVMLQRGPMMHGMMGGRMKGKSGATPSETIPNR